MIVGIVGSRKFQNFDVSLFGEYIPDSCTGIVSGGAVGVDSAAEAFAAENGIPFTKFLPDYARYGRRAALERNLLIVKNCDMLLAFWDCESKGTAHTINACIRENVPVRVIPHD